MSNPNPNNPQNNLTPPVKNPPQFPVLISMGGAGAGKGTAIEAVQKNSKKVEKLFQPLFLFY